MAKNGLFLRYMALCYGRTFVCHDCSRWPCANAASAGVTNRFQGRRVIKEKMFEENVEELGGGRVVDERGAKVIESFSFSSRCLRPR